MVFFMVCADNHHKKEIDFNSLLRYFDFHRLRHNFAFATRAASVCASMASSKELRSG